jgi:hypothetical protein
MSAQKEPKASTIDYSRKTQEHLSLLKSKPWYNDALFNIPKCQVDYLLNEVKNKTGSNISEKESRESIMEHFYANRICNYCKNVPKEDIYSLSACGKCHLVYYCNSICQRKDWSERNHSRWCCNKGLNSKSYLITTCRCTNGSL